MPRQGPIKNIRLRERTDGAATLKSDAGYGPPPPDRPDVDEVARRIWAEWPKQDPHEYELSGR